MAVQEQTESTSLDTLKIIVALALLAASVIGYYYFDGYPDLYRSLGVVAVVLVAIGVFMTANQGVRLRGFMKGSRTELRKVVWPTRQETVQTTGAVIFMVFVVAIFLWLLDTLLGWGVQKIIAGG